MDDSYDIGLLLAPTQIAVTRYTDAVRCPLQFVLSYSFETSKRRPPLPSSSAHRYIGTVHHRVIEAARKGEVGTPPNRPALERRWQKELSQIESAVQDNGDGVWLPFEQSHPDLERARLRCITIAEQQQVCTGESEVPFQAAGIGRGTRHRVSGKIDAIETQNGRTVLKDFKSGHLDDPSDLSEKVKPQYRDQMLLYASLHFQSCGFWADALCLVNKSGQHTELEWSREQAQATFQSAMSHLDFIERTIGRGGTLREERISNLANPDKGLCSRCQYRPICPAYRDRLHLQGLRIQQDSKYSLVDTVGTVLGATQTDTGVHVHLQCSDDIERSIQSLPVQAQCLGTSGAQPVPTAVDPISPGDNVMVFNVRPRRSLHDAQEAPVLIVHRATRSFRTPLSEHD
jgi:hypothetical protein